MPIEFNNSLSADRLRELLTYHPETGIFTWNHSRGSRMKGGIAGIRNTTGARQIQIDGRPYVAHRLAWLYVHGVFPDNEIDHRDGQPDNNRWVNLRPATHAQNMKNYKRPKNNKSGFKGVHWHKELKRWRACITSDGIRIIIGSYDSPEEGHAAYCAKAKELHGEFARAS